jgi:para-nitrobenzyl esterase
MMAAFVAFARHGDPNHEGLPEWPAYDAARRATMVFGSRCSSVDDYRGVGRIVSTPLLRPQPARLLRGALFRSTR